MGILAKLRASFVLAGTAAVVASGLSAGSAQAAVQYYEVRPQHSYKCLDVAHLSQAHGADVVQGNCWGGPNQHWAKVNIGGGSFELRAQHSNKCLDVAHASVAHGADVVQGDCWGGANQRWFEVNAGNGFVQLRALHSNKCLDVAHASVAHGANVVQGDCWGGANQRWVLIPI